MPPNTVKVDRTTPWGNPFTTVRCDEGWEVEDTTGNSQILVIFETRVQAVEASLAAFREHVKALDLEPLRGLNLACWCKPGDPCHADVLLEIANRPTAGRRGDRR
jgi:hypothetical protein